MEFENISGEVDRKEYYRKDLIKALTIVIYSFLSAAALTLLIYFFI